MRQDNEHFADLPFPVKGIDLSRAFGLQIPGTTPVGQNVRAFDPLTARARGGQRPGLSKYGPQVFGSGLVQELAVVVGVGYTPPAPSAGPSVLQGSGGTTGTGSTTTESFDNNVTVGSGVIVLCGSVDGSRAFPTGITDTAGNTYTRLTTSSLSNAAVSTWLATNVVGGFTDVTVTWGSGGSGTVNSVAFELASIPTASAADHSSTPTGASTSGTGINITTQVAHAIVFGAIQGNGQSVSRTGGSYFNLQTSHNFLVCYKTTSAIVTTGADLTFSFSGFNDWAGIIQGVKGL